MRWAWDFTLKRARAAFSQDRAQRGDLAGLNRIVAEDDLGYVMAAVRTIRRELNGAVR